MGLFDLVLIFEIGDCAGDAERFQIGSSGEGEFVGGSIQEVFGTAIEIGVLAEVDGGQARISFMAKALTGISGL